jgi:hypothetical protein
MPGPVQLASQTMQKFWALVYGEGAPAAPEVVVHDPAAQGPRDLDDPFIDDRAQTRAGDVIAGAGQKKK